DGTVIAGRNYLSSPDQVELIPGAAASLRALSQLGLGLIIATNQSGIGRGYFDQPTLAQIHERLCSLLETEGVRLDGIYFCPHTPEEVCHCRKPEVGMLEEAASQVGLDPTASFVVGDNWSDIELGSRVGATTLLVRTGYGRQVEADQSVKPDYVVDDITQAASVIKQLVEHKQG
ncbi:MAG: HAD family hydrolase, partial [Chloroflexi bacterium]|nr:HAD family hydrolase [Chloroflexota bacterium]